jgi:energy-coupling factor transport system permease protein
MLQRMSLGSYYPGTSVLHHLQARTKLLVLIWLVVWLSIANHLKWHLEPYGLALILLGLGLYFSRISPRMLWQRIWLLVILMLLGLWPILTSDSDTSRSLLTIGPFGLPYGTVKLILLIVGSVGGVLLLSMYLPFLRDLWERPKLQRVRRPIWLLTLISFFLYWLSSGFPDKQLFLLGPALITETGVWSLITFSSFLLLLYAYSLLLTMTTSPMALIEGLSMMLGPLRRLHLPIDSFALMALLALRFIPTLLEETEQLSKAQTARGADLSSGTLRERLQSLVMLFIPLIQGVFRQASELATALEARGYQSEGKQTALYETNFQRDDYIVAIVVVIATLASLLF